MEWHVEPQETLRKTTDNPAQSGLEDADARRANVLGVYEAVRPENIAGKRFLLIDDICTTGPPCLRRPGCCVRRGCRRGGPDPGHQPGGIIFPLPVHNEAPAQRLQIMNKRLRFGKTHKFSCKMGKAPL